MTRQNLETTALAASDFPSAVRHGIRGHPRPFEQKMIAVDAFIWHFGHRPVVCSAFPAGFPSST
jgi:hypothetical protein